MSSWMIVTSPANFDKTAELEFKVQGMKSRHRKKALKMAEGDRILYYITGKAAFAAVAEVASSCFEAHTRIWSTAGKPDEDYPWRVRLRNVDVLPEGRWVPANDIKDRLVFVRKWPAAHWKLAFQGNVHSIPDSDLKLVCAALEEARVSYQP